MAVELATFEQIARILSQLSTNYTNLFVDYYNIFYNPTPLDVNLKYYTQTGDLKTVTIPNRAKDRSYILNGNGSPEGRVSGKAGVIYQDLTNGELYIKQVSSPEMNGWEKAITTSDLANTITKGAGNPEGVVVRERGSLYVDTISSSLYIKTTTTGNNGWLLVSANTTILAKTDLSNLTSEGETVVKTLADAAISSNETVASKQSMNDRVQAIDENSKTTEYPSAKAVYTALSQVGGNAANKDLSNLTDEGAAKLRDRYSFGILNGNNKLTVDLNNVITLDSGVILLMANGRKEGGIVNNIEVTLNSPVSCTVSMPSEPFENGIVYYCEPEPSPSGLRICNADYFFVQDDTPVSYENGLWYNPSTNYFSYYDNNSWIEIKGVIVGTFKFVEGEVTELNSYESFVVANANDLYRVENRIKQVEEKIGKDVEAVGDLVNPLLQVEDPAAATPTYSLAANGLYIETKTSGDRWSRVYYTDNTKENVVWIEQGGTISTSSDQLVTIEFLVHFSNTNYFIHKNFAANNLSSVGMAYLGFWDKTVQGATTRSMGSTYNQCWYACGR